MQVVRDIHRDAEAQSMRVFCLLTKMDVVLPDVLKNTEMMRTSWKVHELKARVAEDCNMGRNLVCVLSHWLTQCV